MAIASTLYAFVARARRRAWERPDRRRRLRRPVISVGNLSVGGSGKTPTVAYVARLLTGMGERPAVLTRGYARRRPVEGVVVVSDGVRVLADLDRSGDEPLMLARALAGVVILVSPDRYLAGRLAELHFGATVHLLDDGFQHLALARDIDLLIVSADEMNDGRTLPSGRLREPLAAARRADALLVPGAAEDEARALGERLGVPTAFGLVRTAGRPRLLDRWPGSPSLEPGSPVFAVAGIARPERFFADVARSGLQMAGMRAFADHHRYTGRDVADIERAARQAGARAVITTEKDLMRLMPLAPFPMPLAWLPLDVRVEPAEAFRAWLQSRLSPLAGAGVRSMA